MKSVKQPWLRAASLIVALSLACACVSSCGDAEPPVVCKEFFKLPLGQHDEAFQTYSPEKQIEIYRCGMERRPPEQGLAYGIADGGEKNIPLLLAQFNAEQDEWMQNAFIYVFLIMSRNGSLRGRHDVVGVLKRKVSAMRIPQMSRESQEALTEIERNVGG